jgi:hypothetical protein
VEATTTAVEATTTAVEATTTAVEATAARLGGARGEGDQPEDGNRSQETQKLDVLHDRLLSSSVHGRGKSTNRADPDQEGTRVTVVV